MGNGVWVHLCLAHSSVAVTVSPGRKFCCFPPPASLPTAFPVSVKKEIMESQKLELGKMGWSQLVQNLSLAQPSVLCLVCSAEITITPLPWRGNYSKYEKVSMLRIFSLSPLTILKVIGKCISNLSILDQYFYSIKLVSEEQETSSFARFLYQIVTRWVFVAESFGITMPSQLELNAFSQPARKTLALIKTIAPTGIPKEIFLFCCALWKCSLS